MKDVERRIEGNPGSAIAWQLRQHAELAGGGIVATASTPSKNNSPVSSKAMFMVPTRFMAGMAVAGGGRFAQLAGIPPVPLPPAPPAPASGPAVPPEPPVARPASAPAPPPPAP